MLIEILTVGLPFCGFKLSAGAVFSSWALLVWGAIDLVLNTVNAVSVMLVDRRVLPVCVTHFLFVRQGSASTRSEAHSELGLATDMALSFALVAFVVGSGAIATFPQEYGLLWNVSVVLNVLGAGLGRFRIALVGVQRPKPL